MHNKPLKNHYLYEFGPFRLNVAERRLTRDGQAVPLQPKALELLRILVSDAGHLKTREELIAGLWPNTVVEEQGLTLRLHALRQALGDNRETPIYIETVRGVGYRFIAPVAVEVCKPGASRASGPPTVGRRSGRRRRMAASGVLLAAIIVVVVIAGAGALFSDSHNVSAATPSIAVLPFENLSTDKNNAYFAAGIQDEILTKLAKISDVKVISRTSTEQYKSHPANLQKIARQLGVATVLEGSVQKTGDEVHINVQLINAHTQDHIWAHSYNRSLADVFGVESEVAARVAAALVTKLLPDDFVRLQARPTRDSQAYLQYLKANYIAFQVFGSNNSRGPADDMAQAASLYRQAIARDPGFAAAYARLSLLEIKNYWYYDHAPGIAAKAEQAAKQALRLAPDLPRARMAMGYAEYYGHTNYRAALVQFDLAAARLPNNADVIAAIAYVHRRQGKWHEALAEFRRVRRLDPRNPRRHYVIGTTLTAMGQYGSADQQFKQALAMEPEDYVAMTYRIWMLLHAGRLKQAKEALAHIPDRSGQEDFVFTLGFEAAWLSRDPERAFQVLAKAPAWIPGTELPYSVPTSLLRGRAWKMKGNTTQAQLAFQDARSRLKADLEQRPGFAAHWAALGMAEAELGNRVEAIHDGKHAVQLRPVSRDAFSGPAYLVTLAMIYARTGNVDKAVALLRKLIEMPAGAFVSVPLLRMDPAWDSARNQPGFQMFLKRSARKEAPPSASGA